MYFNLMKHFEFKNISYLGIDIVPNVIQKNIETYATQTINFDCQSITDYQVDSEFDLVLIKDVLQHLSSTNITKILQNTKHCKCVIVTNDYSVDNNNEISDGEYSSIDLLQSPYNLIGSYIFEWQSCNFLKKSLMVRL